MSVWRFLLMGGALAMWPGSLRAQVLTLGQALDRAGQHAYGNRIADAQARAQEGQAAQALRGFLPSVRVEGGYVRTTDPLGAFGARLRQRSVTAASFDPTQLNYPAAIGNLSSGLVLELPVFNADALFGRQAARRAAAAARSAATWERAGTSVDVIRAYYGAILAAEQVATLDSGAAAARAHLRMAESLHRHGLATRSDALLAAVRAGQVEADLLAARGTARLARTRLAMALGTPGDTAFVLPAHLPDTTTLIALSASAAQASTAMRADVQAAALALQAAEANQRRASALMLPRVNSFGRLDWNSGDSPFAGQDAWTAGIMISWSPFSGGSELAERRTATAGRQAAAAAAEAATAQGELELQEARNSLEVALARTAITADAVDQSAEAHRIVTRKYEGGLATAVELFDAAAEETAARLGFADARFRAIVAMADVLRASGQDPASLASLDQTEP